MPTARLLQITQLGHPILRDTAREVTDPQDPFIQTLTDDMMATLDESKGVGLAAPQVYQPLRLIIISSRWLPMYQDALEVPLKVLINPRITFESNDTTEGWEACLSFPGIRAKVRRSKQIDVSFLTQQGERQEQTLKGFLARVFKHEYDHLNGVMFTDSDRADPLSFMSEVEYQKMVSLLPKK